MRKTISTLLLAICLPSVALAAPTTEKATDRCPGYNSSKSHCYDYGKGHRAGHRGKMHQSRHMGMGDLNLTQEQCQKMRHSMGNQFKSRHAIIQKYLDKLPDADKKAMQAELATARKNNDNAFRSNLTPEQQKKFDEIRAKRAELHKARLEKNAN